MRKKFLMNLVGALWSIPMSRLLEFVWDNKAAGVTGIGVNVDDDR